MELFSYRYGFTKKPKIKLDTMDDYMRIALWNTFYEFLERLYKHFISSQYLNANDLYPFSRGFSTTIYRDYFGMPVDDLKIRSGFYGFITILHPVVYEAVKRHITKDGKWFEVYNFIEFIANIRFHNVFFNSIYEDHINDFVEKCNSLFEQRSYLVRFEKIDGFWMIVPKISKIEKESVMRVLNNESLPKQVKYHLNESIKLMSEKPHPDTRNSIKESISALEAYIRWILNDDKVTLGRGINDPKIKDCISPRIREAIQSIYKFASDEMGIRHSYKPGEEIKEPGLEDAIYILVFSASTINYLSEKILNNPECGGENNGE